MADTTLTIRTDETLKMQAAEVFSSLGMTTTTAINLFMKQAVLTKSFPCRLELECRCNGNYENTYPEGFFSLFGKGKDLGLDEEPEELSFNMDCLREEL